jgi:hypothetical protein
MGLHSMVHAGTKDVFDMDVATLNVTAKHQFNISDLFFFNVRPSNTSPVPGAVR